MYVYISPVGSCVFVFEGLRQREPAVQRPAADAGDAADVGSVLSPESSESSGVGSKQSSLDNLLYVERKQLSLLISHSLSFDSFVLCAGLWEQSCRIRLMNFLASWLKTRL